MVVKGVVMKKECYGILDRVFPVSENGLREITPECFHCPDRTPCLRAALCTKEGLQMRAEMLDRAVERGLVGRVRRWSQKKELNRLMKEQKEKGR